MYVVGGRVAVTRDEVDRAIDPSSVVAAGERVQFVGNVFGPDSPLVRSATVATWHEAGVDHRVWEFEADRGTEHVAFVHVHGLGAAPAATLRSVDAVTRLGGRSTIVSLDGNPDLFARVRGVRASAVERVVAAIGRASERGARQVVLVGWSFGAQLALHPAAGRGDVAGVVLISPTTDLLATLRAEARHRGVPPLVAALGAAVLTTPGLSRVAGLDRPLRRDARHLAATKDLPLLVMHSGGDATLTAPSGAGDHATAGRVSFAEFPAVPHTLEWNADPALFERALGLWLSRLGLSGRGPSRPVQPAQA